MSDATTPEIGITDLSSQQISQVTPLTSYKGETPGTLRSNPMIQQEKSSIAPPSVLPKIGSEISTPEKQKQEAEWLQNGKLLADAGIILNTDGKRLTGMKLPEDLIPDEVNTLNNKITNLEEELRNLRTVKVEYDALMLKLKNTPANISSSNAETTKITTSLEQTPSVPEKNILRSRLISPRIKTNSEAKDEEPTMVEPQLSTPLPIENILPAVSTEKETVPPSVEVVISPEEKKNMAVNSLIKTLDDIHGDDWKKRIIQPQTVKELPSEIIIPKITEASPEEVEKNTEWRNSFENKELLDNVVNLDEKSLLNKYIKSEDQNFLDGVLRAACFDVSNKETAKSIFGEPLGVTVDSNKIDHRTEIRNLLEMLSGLDEKAVSQIGEDEISRVNNIYSSPTLTISDYISHVKSDINKADSSVKK